MFSTRFEEPKHRYTIAELAELRDKLVAQFSADPTTEGSMDRAVAAVRAAGATTFPSMTAYMADDECTVWKHQPTVEYNRGHQSDYARDMLHVFFELDYKEHDHGEGLAFDKYAFLRLLVGRVGNTSEYWIIARDRTCAACGVPLVDGEHHVRIVDGHEFPFRNGPIPKIPAERQRFVCTACDGQLSYTHFDTTAPAEDSDSSAQA